MDSKTQPITVFHVRNSNYAGGIETTLFGWFKYANRKNIIPRLFIFRERRQLHERSVEILKANGITAEILPWGKMRNLPAAVYQLRREVRSVASPVLHSHDTRSDLVALIVSWLTGAPLVISNHAWHPADFKRKLLETIRAYLMRGADLVISVSKDTHEETLEKGLPDEKCIPMYSGIDLEPYRDKPSFDTARKYLGISKNHFLIGNIARLWPEKEQDKIIDAAKILTDRYPEMRFVIIGDGPLMDPLKSKVASEHLEDIVFLTGFKDDFVTALAALDCFAFPSSAEGTPMVIYSAMAMGIPIVSSPVSGIGEILQHEDSALLVPPADAGALASAIERLYLDQDLAKKIGNHAQLSVEEIYSAEHAVDTLESIYIKLVSGSKGSAIYNDRANIKH